VVKSARRAWLSAVLIAIVACTGQADTPGPERVQVFSASEQQAITVAFQTVRQAILAEDISSLLSSISASEGLICTDTRYTGREIQAFLANKQSEFYVSLFRSEAFGEKCGDGYPVEYPALSESEFLRTANASVAITRVDADWARVTITSPVRTHYPREWYFHREGGTWKIGGASFVIGNCTCG
jgi:hypothetical protein